MSMRNEIYDNKRNYSDSRFVMFYPSHGSIISVKLQGNLVLRIFLFKGVTYRSFY